MASDVTIVNRALTLLGEDDRITAFSDDSKPARLAVVEYAELRDVLLQEHPWNFATHRVSLAASAIAPVNGYARAFPLPSDCWQIDWVNDELEDRPWRVEQHEGVRSVLTDIEAPIIVRYRRQVTDAELMTPVFRELLSARLAMEWALAITGDRSIEQGRALYYAEKLAVARSLDGQETSPLEYVDSSSWVDSRR